MKFTNKAAEAAFLFRGYMDERIKQGTKPLQVFIEMQLTMRSLVDAFFVKYDCPGVRYWEIPWGSKDGKTHLWVVTLPGQTLNDAEVAEYSPIELDRDTFLCRQGLANGEEDMF